MTHVLVVEDDAINARLFCTMLEKRGGFRVTVSEDPREILALTAEGRVDVVIMDVSLAHSMLDGRPLNGVELCHRIKSDPRSASIPVVLATAHAMRGDAETLLRESGADGYVSKPILDHASFVDQIRRLLEEAA